MLLIREVFIHINAGFKYILKKSVCAIKSSQGTGLMDLLSSMSI